MKKRNDLKKIALAALLAFYVLITTGCAGSAPNGTETGESKETQNVSQQGTKDSQEDIVAEIETSTNEPYIETESESDKTSEKEESVFDGIQEFPQYDIRKLDIESLLSEDEEVSWMWDTQIIDENIHLVMLTYEKMQGYRYKLVTCDLYGRDLQSVTLQLPESKSEVLDFDNFKIGLDGNVYAVKYEVPMTLMSCTEEGCSIVSWDFDGKFRFETKPKAEDYEKYDALDESSLYLFFRGVSEQGELIFKISNYYRAILVHTSSDSRVLDIRESEPGGTIFSSNWNQDGSFSFIFQRGSVRDGDCELFYVTYDIDSKIFSEPISIPYEVGMADKFGIDKDVLIVCEEERGILCKFYPVEDKLEPLTKLGEEKELKEVLVINDKTLLMSFSKKVGIERVFDGIYFYTLINE